MSLVKFVFNFFSFSQDELDQWHLFWIWHNLWSNYFYGTLLLKYFTGDYCLLVWSVLLSCEINPTLERVVFSQILSEVWDQNTLHCLSQKGYYSIGCITVRAENCNTHLHEILSIWWLGFTSLSFWYKLL